MRERAVKEAVKKALKELGAYQHWPVQNGMGAPCLDCHGCYNGVYFAIETKRPGKKPTERQEFTIEQIVASGGLVFVIDKPEDVSVIVDRLKTHTTGVGAVHRTYQGVVD